MLIENANSKQLEQLIPGRGEKINWQNSELIKESMLRLLQRIDPLKMNWSGDSNLCCVLKETAIENKPQKVENEKDIKNSNKSIRNSRVLTPTTRKIKSVNKFSM